MQCQQQLKLKLQLFAFSTRGHVTGTFTHFNRTSAKACISGATPLPVDVALHLFASTLGYFSRRRHVWGSARVPRIQMKATVCKVSVGAGGRKLITENWYIFMYIFSYNNHGRLIKVNQEETHWYNLINERHLQDILKLEKESGFFSWFIQQCKTLDLKLWPESFPTRLMVRGDH